MFDRNPLTHSKFIILLSGMLWWTGCDLSKHDSAQPEDVSNQVTFGETSPSTASEPDHKHVVSSTKATTPMKAKPKIVPGKPRRVETIDFSEEDALPAPMSTGGLGDLFGKNDHDPKMGAGGMGMKRSSIHIGKKKAYEPESFEGETQTHKKRRIKKHREKRSDFASLAETKETPTRKTSPQSAADKKRSALEAKKRRAQWKRDQESRQARREEFFNARLEAKRKAEEADRAQKERELLAMLEASGEEYENYGVNPMTKTSEDRFSTFAIDVDTGSYTIARRKLNEGVMPPAASVRVEEFVNYFDHGYEDPEQGAFGVSFDGAPSPFRGNVPRKLVRIGVQGDRLIAKERAPMHLVFLVDVSGSMNTHDKIGLIKDSLSLLIENLGEEDTVALVTYAAHTKIALPPTRATDTIKILEGILELKPGGGTAMGNAMKTAYQLAIQDVKPGHVSRVIVLSDGDANIGATTIEDVFESVQTYVDEGVTLSSIGFGMGNYKDSMMEQLANKGNGNYYYIDSPAEAHKIFAEQLLGTMQVIAKDVKIQVEFNPELVESYRLVGYENRDIADQDFRNDRVDAGEIGAGHSVTALYEIELLDAKESPLLSDAVLATVRVRHKQPQGHEAIEQAYPLFHASLAEDMNMASSSFQFAVAVAGFAEQLRGSPYVRDFGFDQILALASKLDKPSARQLEFITLVERAKKLM